MASTISEAVRVLPFNGVRAVFAYGSGVFRQSATVDVRKNMLDLVLVVNDSQTWHQANLEKNPHHYSFIKYAGAGNIYTLQRKFSAGCYCNTMLELAGRSAKYTVVEMDDLCEDLETWKYLYISGRLHKPVKFVLHPHHSHTRLCAALSKNLHSAVAAAIVQLPETFSARDLYLKIAGLSYQGDVRMSVGGEDRNKIANVVDNNIERFEHLYRPVLVDWFGTNDNVQFDTFTQDISRHMRHKLLKSLPPSVMAAMLRSKGRTMDETLLLAELSDDRLRCANGVRDGLASIVDRSSRKQMTKNIVSAGITKSVLYASQKVKKYWASSSNSSSS
eukprot:scpid84107/ scgid31940/ Mitochondrial translocator assembly and maintenance protein 41 homolog; MMP37-like protein, mitochondrial